MINLLIFNYSLKSELLYSKKPLDVANKLTKRWAFRVIIFL